MLHDSYDDLTRQHPENQPTAMQPAEKTTAASPRKQKKRTLAGKIRLAALFIILVLLTLIQAPVFPHVIGTLLRIEAWSNGVSLHVGKIEATIFEPVVFKDTVCTYRAESGAVTRLEIRSARAWLAWSNLFPEPLSHWLRSAATAANIQPIGQNGIWFQELELDGLTAKLSLPSGITGEAGEDRQTRRLQEAFGHLNLRPGLLTVRNADLIVQRAGDYFWMAGAFFTLGEIAPGSISARQLVWKVDGVNNAFRDVRGRTSLQDSRATIAGVRLAPDVMVQTFAISVRDIAAGRLALSTELDAFGGSIKAEAETWIEDKQLYIDVNVPFSKINVAVLAGFLGLSEATGGIINDGRFSFRGTPRDFTRGEATIRIEAGSFQWESRQWDSLVLGLSLLDQRLQIPELRLRQGGNQLTLKGSMALPHAGAPWWERQFDFKVDADIRNLTDLSALVMPDFKYAAGQLFIQGSVSGSGATNGTPANFEGQLIASGNNLQWRTAPLDMLQAAFLFHGRELQIITAQLFHNDDYLRGSGRISLGDGSYSGEWRLSARDLATYKSVLTPYFLPAPLGGGVNVTWSGNGAASKHTGNFTARLQRFHLLGPGGTLPLDAECKGTYRPGELQLENIRLAEDGTELTAGVSIGPSAVNLHGLRVQHNGRTWLQGDAFLPLDLWQRWPDIDFAHMLNDETVSRIHLEATELDLRQASRLTGIDWPLSGALIGKIDANGALPNLKLGGSVYLMRGTVPLDWHGRSVSALEANFTMDGTTISVEKAAGKHTGGTFELTGKLDLAKPRNPSLHVDGSGLNQSEPFQFTVRGAAAHPVIETRGPAPFGGMPAVQPQAPPAPAAN